MAAATLVPKIFFKKNHLAGRKCSQVAVGVDCVYFSVSSCLSHLINTVAQPRVCLAGSEMTVTLWV